MLRNGATETEFSRKDSVSLPKESLTGDSERFSFFQRGDKSQTPQGTGDIYQLYHKLTTSPDWQKKIARLRHLPPDAQGDAKVKLPAFTASIVLRPGAIRNTVKDGDFTHAHLIQADFDDSFDFDALFHQLKADPHVRLVFHSPRGKVKALIRVDPVHTIEDHRSAFQSVADYCQVQGYGEIDPKPKNIAALCFISYDPRSVLKDAVPLPWDLLPEPLPPASEQSHIPIEHQTTLDEWRQKHNIRIHGTRRGPTQSGGTATMLLVTCPWEAEHTTDFGDKDTAIFEDPVTGKWSFNCFHAHCDGRGWEDYRAKVAPQSLATISNRYSPTKRRLAKTQKLYGGKR